MYDNYYVVFSTISLSSIYEVVQVIFLIIHL